LKGNPEEKRALLVPKCRRKNFKRDFKETGRDNCAVLGYYAASPEDVSDRMSRNFGMELPLLAA
jgi:hypothetical protein